MNPVEKPGCCVEFEFLVTAAESYTDSILGEGWGDCDEHVGKKMSVQIKSDFLGDQKLAVGQKTVIWRDAVDMEVNGEMCTVVGFSGVRPTK